MPVLCKVTWREQKAEILLSQLDLIYVNGRNLYTVIVQQTIVHNTRKVLEANDAVNSMRCQVLYFIKTCREKKKKEISNSRARRDVE